MTILQLQYFREVAKYLSFSNASKSLHVTQPAISIGVRDLESELGSPLFDRSGKSIRLTECGQYLLKSTESVFRGIEEIERRVRDIKIHGNQLRVGVSPQFTASVMRGLYTRLLGKGFPVRYTDDEASHITDRLTAGVEDVGIVPDTGFVPSGFATAPVGRVEVVVCVPEGHELAGRESVSYSDICNLRHAFQAPLVREATGINSALSALLRLRSIRAEGTFFVSQSGDLLRLILEGGFVGVLYHGTLRSQGIRELHLDPPVYDNVLLVCQSARLEEPNVQDLLTHAKEVLEANTEGTQPAL